LDIPLAQGLDLIVLQMLAEPGAKPRPADLAPERDGDQLAAEGGPALLGLVAGQSDDGDDPPERLLVAEISKEGEYPVLVDLHDPRRHRERVDDVVPVDRFGSIGII